MFKGRVTDSLQIFTILTDTLSYPCDLLESNKYIIDNISLFETRKDLILVLVLYRTGGSTLFIGVYIEAKKILKSFAFLQ